MKPIDQQLKKGILSVIVLKLISERDSYGYELIQNMKAHSDTYYTMKEGTLYPVLYRLEEAGLIESYRYFDEDTMKVPRKYYRITEDGKTSLKEYVRAWRNFTMQTDRLLMGGSSDD